MRILKSLNRCKPSRAQLVAGALILSAGALAYAVPNVFTSGTTISASQMNANFAALESQIATLQSQVSNLVAINQYLSLQTVNGQPTVRFTGVNVQVVNGQGSTATANGTGNLIVGYDEAYSWGQYRCTLGRNPLTGAVVIDQATCTNAGGTWTNTGFKTGSHYFITGSGNNYSRWGGVVFGAQNTSNFDFASVSGGTGNTASGAGASVSGGEFNNASGTNASVSGGYFNTANGLSANVNGGGNNTASGSFASVSGGAYNIASGGSANVSGGYSNTTSGNSASVSGGSHNTASGTYAHVSGGGDGTMAGGNVADTNYSSILGGVGQNTSAASQTIPVLP